MKIMKILVYGILGGLGSKNKMSLLICLIIFSFECFSQTSNEIADFINETILSSIKSAIDPLNIDKITVSEKGKLTIDYFMNLSEPKLRLMESRSAYLKNLSYSETKYFKLDGDNNYVIILKCYPLNDCVTRKIIGQDNVSPYTELSITVYDKQSSEQIKQAILSLLNKAWVNPKYDSKDPF